MKLKCKETVKDSFEMDVLFEKDKEYDFIEVNNKFTKRNDFIGYFIKDEDGFKRWSTREFKDNYFEIAN